MLEIVRNGIGFHTSQTLLQGSVLQPKQRMVGSYTFAGSRPPSQARTTDRNAISMATSPSSVFLRTPRTGSAGALRPWAKKFRAPLLDSTLSLSQIASVMPVSVVWISCQSRIQPKNDYDVKICVCYF